MNERKGLNDAECFFKLYGDMICTVPFYFDHFDAVAKVCLNGEVKVIR
jgi:hypothetical protein